MLRKLFVFAAIAMFFVAVQAGTAGASYVFPINASASPDAYGNNLSGWSYTTPESNTYAIVVPVSQPGPPAGNEVDLGTYGSGQSATISTNFSTVANQAYTITFWLANDDYTGSSQFKALWNNNQVSLTELTFNSPLPSGGLAFAYNEFEFTATAASASTALGFNFLNDNSVYQLTDVEATETPIPGAIWLFGPGLVGLIGLKRKYLG